jgi:hypothetical protein
VLLLVEPEGSASGLHLFRLRALVGARTPQVATGWPACGAYITTSLPRLNFLDPSTLRAVEAARIPAYYLINGAD